MSEGLIKDFRGSRYFDIVGEVRGYRPIDQDVDKNHALLGVVIPDDYSRNSRWAR